MEPMAAAGQHPGLLAIGQLGEADGALEALLEVRRPVYGDRQRPERGTVQAASGVGAVCSDEDEARPGGAAEGRIGATQVTPATEVNEEKEDYGQEEEDNRRYHPAAVYARGRLISAAAAHHLISWLRHLRPVLIDIPLTP
ncbi:hypothetical protein MUK42_19775 [Musa troglodytarum]|uniref:Uncharacterized protein n=1 Tax=Musa troglodytarum TaxID=320322 RepID=A0A9E7FT47_9LILI|nr:hypothetical protein MUK42_19775 [Musa troglodytarum]